MEEPKDYPPCKVCGMADHPLIAPQHRHKIDCSAVSLEELRAIAQHWEKQWIDSYNHYQKLVKRFADQTVFWQGKHAIVRHENNKLRAAAYRKKTKPIKEGKPQ